MIIEPLSLVKTLDNVNESFLVGETIPTEKQLETAQWLIARQGEKGSYRGMPAPTAIDFEHGIRTFTGERLVSASARHIMGQEAARVTWLLGSSDPDIRKAYEKATAWMHEHEEFQQTGTFCCNRCTLAFWRHYWIGDFDHKVAYLQKGLQVMKGQRSGDGRWHRFPFYYAVYALHELNLEPALDELKYARPVMEKFAHKNLDDVYSRRRRAIIQIALAKIG